MKCPYCGCHVSDWIVHKDDPYNGHWKCFACKAMFPHEWRYDSQTKRVIRN